MMQITSKTELILFHNKNQIIQDNNQTAKVLNNNKIQTQICLKVVQTEAATCL